MSEMTAAKAISRWKNYFRQSHLGFRDAVYDFAGWQCEDPRDKIFALLGFMDLSVSIRPRYDMSAEHLCESAIRESFKTKKHNKDRYVEVREEGTIRIENMGV
jgi:hypothetical protein